MLDVVDVAGLEREGNGLGEEDAGVFEVVVDEDGDGDEAGGVGLEHVAGPLVDADGAGDALGSFRRGASGRRAGAPECRGRGCGWGAWLLID